MYELRWYQSESVAATWNHLCHQAGNPVIVLPTGAGKSLVIADLCREAIQKYRGRVIVLAHRKELLEQNAEKIRALLPDMDVGIYSAGLRSRDTEHDLVVGGIQSVFGKSHEFGSRQLAIIDEAHLVPHDGEGMYRTFLESLRSVNPRLRLVGLTATPYRLDCGPLCRADALFQTICYSAPVKRLIEEGFLCALTSSPAESSVDTSRLKLRGGEFVSQDAERAFDAAAVVNAACREIAIKTVGRKSILVFCSGVQHASHVAAQLAHITGDAVDIVTGETPPLERQSILTSFKKQYVRYLCNVDVLTTGFDAPCIDAIAILRATMSPGLFAQMCGRGFRIHESKQSCVILDFGENIKRHGSLDMPNYGMDEPKKGDGDAPTKECPNCQAACPLGSIECYECGFVFPIRETDDEIKARHNATSSDGESVLSKPRRWVVEEISMHVHRKKDSPSRTLRVDYLCLPIESKGGNLEHQKISEWVCIEHDGYARLKAAKWWRVLSKSPFPEDIEDAIDLWKRGAVATVNHIETIRESKFLRIVKHEHDGIPELWDEELVEVDFETANDDADIPF